MAAKPLIEHLNGVTRYGLLTVLREVEPKFYGGTKDRHGLVRCECGTERVVSLQGLKKGQATSCGCQRSERARRLGFACRKHGHTKPGNPSPEYRSWIAMKTRCNNPNHRHFDNYGGRGIRVCERWVRSFENFLADMGPRPSLQYSLDRIDSEGGYEPGNCRWATRSEQNRNRRKRRA